MVWVFLSVSSRCVKSMDVPLFIGVEDIPVGSGGHCGLVVRPFSNDLEVLYLRLPTDRRLTQLKYNFSDSLVRNTTTREAARARLQSRLSSTGETRVVDISRRTH